MGNKRPDSRTAFLANVTMWAPKAKSMFTHVYTNVPILSELHQRGEKRQAMTYWQDKEVWNIIASHAAPSRRTEDGTPGGILVAARRFNETQRIDPKPFAPTIGHVWDYRMAHLRGGVPFSQAAATWR